MKSYYRKCKSCSRNIQLRQMPAGQWVAFEGYDKPHDCSRAPNPKLESSKESHQKRTRAEASDTGYDDLDFVNVQVDQSPSKTVPARGTAGSVPTSLDSQAPPLDRGM